jgi:hypothetical protein
MNQFLRRIAVFTIPLILICSIPIGTFYILDPFRVLNKYEEYNNSIVSYNEDFVATERFLKNRGKYNSFILGSSRAGCGFQVDAWKEKLQKTDEAFSFAASNESIFGILGKMRLLDEENVKIDNVILVIDTDVTIKNTVNSPGHIYIKHPRISGESKKAFISEYLKDYIFTGFFIRYLDYCIFKTKRNYMTGFLNFDNINQDDIYIPFNIMKKENSILSETNHYYKERENIFYKRPIDEQYCNPSINSRSKEFLNEIHSIFRKHNTNYKVVISPLYDQKKISKSDIKILNEIFSKKNVFDFSGKNSITNDKHNYYETSHYRIHVGEDIIATLYNKKD